MGGQTGSQTQQTQQTTQLPPWINDAAQQNYAQAQNIASRPLTQYGGAMVPDTSPQMQQSWDYAAQVGNAGKPQYDAASAGFMGALGQTPMSVNAGQVGDTDLSKYMNPYTKSVIDTTMPIMQQALGQQQSQLAGTAAQNNAFGGSRFGVAQGVLGAQGAQGIGQMAAGLNQANFTQAQAAATGDINRQLTADTSNQQAQQAKINSDIQASQGLNQTGSYQQTGANNAFTMLNTAGSQQMAQQQNEINANMNKFNQAWNYPTNQLSVLQSALGMTPYGQSMSGTSNTQTSTPMDWGALGAAGLGALGTAFGGPLGGMLAGTAGKAATAAKGVTKIPGEAPEGVDTQPYILAPGEAVLTKRAAEHLGRDKIAELNAKHPPVLGALAAPGPRRMAGAMKGPITPLQSTEHRRRVRPPQIRGALGG